MKCGCKTEYDRTDHRHWPDDTDCLLPEAVKLLEYIAAIGRDELARAGKTNLPQFGIEAFLARVDKDV